MRYLVLGIVIVGLLPVRGIAQTLSFEDKATSAGIQTSSGLSSVSVFDYNRDGWDDILIATANTSVQLYLNNQDDTFTEVAASSGISVSGNFSAVLFADLNADGLSDLILAGSGLTPTRVFAGVDSTNFQEESASGVDPGDDVSSIAAADFTGDGLIDLFFTIDSGPDKLYVNDSFLGPLDFRNVSVTSGISSSSSSSGTRASWFDFDKDTDLDIVVLRDDSASNTLYRNEGDDIFSIDDDIGAFSTEVSAGGGSIVWTDFNNDTFPDLFITGDTGTHLFQGTEGPLVDATSSARVELPTETRGAVFADFDLDGDQDLFVATNFSTDGIPTALFENSKGRYTLLDETSGAEQPINATAVASGDFNNDGLPDLFVADSAGASKLLINTTDNNYNWLGVRLTGSTSSSFGLGFTIEVVLGSTTLSRYITSGNSFNAQSSPTAHFGLKSISSVDTLRILRGGAGVITVVDVPINSVVDVNIASSSSVEPRGTSYATAKSRNYPEPFRSQTTIEYSFEHHAEEARINIYNVVGQLVMSQSTGLTPSGRFLIDGGELPPGMYFYRIVTGRDMASGTLTKVGR